MFDISSHKKAGSVKEAISLLTENPDAKLIAGGTDVLIKLREGKKQFSHLVDIHGLKELNFIKKDGDNTIVIGSSTVFSQVIVGGNICNGVTSADSASPLFALNAVLSVQGSEGARDIPIADFYLGPGKVDLKHGEVLTAIKIFSENHDHAFGCYYKYAMRNAMDIATIGCAVNLKIKNGRLQDYRIAFGVAGPVPMRCPRAENMARGQALSSRLIEEISQAVTKEVTPRTSWRASREFRLNIITELAKRATIKALKRAGEELP
jgi:xanthine dehydrogenase FAD-binding subunit